MDSGELEKYLTGEAVAGPGVFAGLEETIRRFPYFQALRFFYLKQLQEIEPERYRTELGKAAVYSASRRNLFCFLEASRYRWVSFFRISEVRDPAGGSDTTLSLIDLFLSRYGNETEQAEAGEAFFQPVADYTAALEAMEGPQAIENVPASGDDQMSLIDLFIGKEADGVPLWSNLGGEPVQKVVPADTEEAVSGTETEGEDAFLTESLAKIYIKQKRYDKALEIIKKLSLKYPEKNIYFADQIRFLEKLIINIKN